MGRLIELSHPIHAGMTTYPGLPVPEISDQPTGTRFTVSRITLVGNSGTYLDTPFHRYREGVDLATLPLDRLADLDGLVVRAPREQRSVDRPVLAPYDVAGRAVLIHTGSAISRRLLSLKPWRRCSFSTRRFSGDRWRGWG